MRARCIPSSPRWMESIYVGPLIRGLERHGVSFTRPASDAEDFVSARWLQKHQADVGLLHFHWTHYHYTRATLHQSAVALLKFAAKLILARRLGYRIVWTMHNYLPHEPDYPALHRAERLVMARCADQVIVHCRRGRELVERNLHRRHGVSVVPLGNCGEFLEHLPQREARRRLEIGDPCRLFLFFGSIRPYKGVPELLVAFRELAGDHVRLAVVGQPLTAELQREVAELARSDARIQVQLRRVIDSELSAYLSAADVAVLPYREVLTSAAAMTALSFGVPVIAPALGCLPELLTSECGFLFHPGPTALASALEVAATANLTQMRRAVRARAAQFPWEQMVQQTAHVYAEAMRGRAG